MKENKHAWSNALAQRVFRWSLLLYPRDCRERDPKGRQYAFIRLLREAQERGRVSTVLFLVRTVRHAIVLGSLERLSRGWGKASGRHEYGRGNIVAELARDLRIATRSLLRCPGLTITAVAAFAVGIAATASVFSLVYPIVLRPLPFPEPERLVFVDGTSPEQGIDRVPLSYPDFEDLRSLSQSFSDLSAIWAREVLTASSEASTLLGGAYVSANLTEMLGIQPIAGRGFREAEQAPGQGQVALIGEGVWKRHFGGDPNVVGKAALLNGAPSTIVGILPDRFRFPENAEIWILLAEQQMGPREHKHLSLVGRLRSEVTPAQASDELNAIAAGLAEEYPETNGDIRMQVRTLREGVFGDEKRPVLIFCAVACLTLLIACANVASLLLARNMARCDEMAMRASLGAGRRRLFQLVLAESLILATLGGVLGVGLGYLSRDIVLAFRGAELPYYIFPELRLDVLLPIAGTVILAGLLTGSLPAVRATRTDFLGGLQRGSMRFSGGRRGYRLNATLVSVEVALALVVLIGTSLMMKSVLRQRSMDLGYEPANVVTLTLRIPDARRTSDQDVWQFYQRTLEEVQSLPDVRAASLVTRLPSDYRTDPWPIVVEEQERSGSSALPQYLYRICDKDYFSVMEIPLLEGRVFDAADAEPTTSIVAVISAEFARQFWPGQDPLGKRFAFGEAPSFDEDWIRVIGVVGDTYNAGYGAPVEPAVYLPSSRVRMGRASIVARIEPGAEVVFASLRKRVESVDPETFVWNMRTMEEAIFRTHWQIRFYALGISLFSGVALLLVLTGVIGIVNQAVTRQRRAYATRMALGASGWGISVKIIRNTLGMTGAGIAAGLFVALIAMRFLSSLLFQVDPSDLVVYVVSAGLLVCAALLASYLPARRLLSFDLMTVLGKE